MSLPRKHFVAHQEESVQSEDLNFPSRCHLWIFEVYSFPGVTNRDSCSRCATLCHTIAAGALCTDKTAASGESTAALQIKNGGERRLIFF